MSGFALGGSAFDLGEVEARLLRPQLIDSRTVEAAVALEPPGSTSESSSSSSITETDEASEEWDEEDAVCLAPRKSGGLLHLALPNDPEKTMCGRCLKHPKVFSGLGEARNSGRSWSPRCAAQLKKQ